MMSASGVNNMGEKIPYGFGEITEIEDGIVTTEVKSVSGKIGIGSEMIVLVKLPAETDTGVS